MAAINLKPGSKGVMALIVVAVVIFVGSILAYLGVAGKMKSTAAELEAKRKKVEESKEIAQKLEKSKLDYLDNLSQIRFLETSVSTEAYIPTLLQQLELVAKSVNLKVTGVTPDMRNTKSASRSVASSAKASEGNVSGASETKDGAPAPKKVDPPYDELSVTVEFKGKYMDVRDFLYKLTSFPKILAVKSVSITPDDTKLCYVQAPQLSVKMVVTAFVLKKDDPVSMPNMPVAPVPAVTTTSSTGEGRGNHEAG